jgi:two-component system OmpR family response regulator
MKVLIVEDEEKLAEALAKGLQHEGYATDIIPDGEKAITRISMHRKDYDIVILDLMLPKVDGLGVCKAVRELGVTLPILVLTARNETENKVDLLLAGADDYLAKPFSFEELCARIKALLRRPAASLPNIIKVQDIELNATERTVTRDGDPIELTLKEFSILEYLMRRPNEVINREDLLSNLWDFNYDSFSNVVDVHVKNLRRKLDRGNASDVLETVRGIGYRLRA